MIMDKNKMPAMYRRLLDVMKGNGYHSAKEMDEDPMAAERMTRAFRITKEDMGTIQKELEKMEKKR